jgi:hypothetical protein
MITSNAKKIGKSIQLNLRLSMKLPKIKNLEARVIPQKGHLI